MGKNLYRLASWFICLAFSVNPGAVLAQAQNKALQVGILPISTTRILIKNYQPLQAYLERELKQPVELVTAHDFKTFHFNTLKGDYDLIITAAHLGRLAQTEANYVPLARYKAPHRTLLLVAKDQPLKSVEDLRGKVIAGIDPLTLAVNETLLWLRRQGLRAGIDFAMLETPTPISAAYSVLNHQSVMAIGSPQGWKQFPDSLRDSLEIFASLPELPSLMWLAHPRMASDAPRIKAALLGFTEKSREGAMFYKATGYIGMKQVSNQEAQSMDALAQEVKIMLQK